MLFAAAFADEIAAITDRALAREQAHQAAP